QTAIVSPGKHGIYLEQLHMIDLSHLRLESLEVGAAPLIDALFDRLQFDRLIGASLSARPLGRPADMPPAKALRALISNVLLSRHPLYAIPGWLALRFTQILATRFSLREVSRRFCQCLRPCPQNYNSRKF